MWKAKGTKKNPQLTKYPENLDFNENKIENISERVIERLGRLTMKRLFLLPLPQFALILRQKKNELSGTFPHHYYCYWCAHVYVHQITNIDMKKWCN